MSQGIVDGYPKQLLTIERRENELKQQRKRLRKEHDIAADKIAKKVNKKRLSWGIRI
jgi:hypothetical protein